MCPATHTDSSLGKTPSVCTFLLEYNTVFWWQNVMATECSGYDEMIMVSVVVMYDG